MNQKPHFDSLGAVSDSRSFSEQLLHPIAVSFLFLISITFSVARHANTHHSTIFVTCFAEQRFGTVTSTIINLVVITSISNCFVSYQT
jgi:hypothetical protein